MTNLVPVTIWAVALLVTIFVRVALAACYPWVRLEVSYLHPHNPFYPRWPRVVFAAARWIRLGLLLMGLAGLVLLVLPLPSPVLTMK